MRFITTTLIFELQALFCVYSNTDGDHLFTVKQFMYDGIKLHIIVLAFMQ